MEYLQPDPRVWITPDNPTAINDRIGRNSIRLRESRAKLMLFWFIVLCRCRRSNAATEHDCGGNSDRLGEKSFPGHYFPPYSHRSGSYPLLPVSSEHPGTRLQSHVDVMLLLIICRNNVIFICGYLCEE